MSLISVSVQAGTAAHWGYEGTGGPDHWGSLGYSTCAEGNVQSPIDITEETPTNQHTLSFRYSDTPINVINNGHTVQFNYQSGSTITVDGKSYDLLQFHFHTPSEDTVNGKPFPMQLHLVHKSADGELAVVGLFLQAGHDSNGNETLDKIFGALPGNAGLNLTSSAQINARDFLPSDQTAWHFMGSLTTPPCSEGVRWYVVKQPIEISANKLARFQAIFKHNARPTQPWNAR
ncbi:MAG: carbonic anhydrase family protein [Magnetococcales bacterium]|nr:carbonic anhydrase family protein [Magnetococcales bacterium]